MLTLIIILIGMYLVIMTFMGVLAIGLSILTVIGVVIRALLKELDKKKNKEH